ncbi:MAG: twin-arginine translocase TatA/TatE family subunit [Acidobacteria bacterium]|nr:twin-arginine translocase TatA/TatE family subunit [Acidobacteriota bacterium]
MFQQIQLPEILLLLLVALLLFGAKRLPEVGRSLGRSLREFKTGVKGLADDASEGLDEEGKQTSKGGPKEE